jgi:hypothetical protein
MPVTAESIIKAAPQQISCQLDDEAALLNLQTGVYYGLDAMGAYIWQRLVEPTRVRELTGEIAREYNVDNDAVEADVIEFLQEMMNAGLVELHEPGV